MKRLPIETKGIMDKPTLNKVSHYNGDSRKWYWLLMILPTTTILLVIMFIRFQPSSVNNDKKIINPTLTQLEQIEPPLLKVVSTQKKLTKKVVTPPHKTKYFQKKFRRYTIKNGDKLMGISKKVYGTQQGWRSIAAANPNLDMMTINVGDIIKIPVLATGILTVPTTLHNLQFSKNKFHSYTLENGDQLIKISNKFNY